jgi:cellulose biosynthesis protein BcsQ
MNLPSITADLMNTVVLVAGNKGGVGKTTTAQGCIEYLQICDIPVHIAQVDRQARLAQLNKCDVLTIESDPDAARADPALEMARSVP